MGGRVADTRIGTTSITFGQISVLFFGIAASLLIEASQYFLHSKEYDVFSIPQRYTELLKDDCEIRKKEWNEFEDEQTRLCKAKEELGRKLYNYALFSMFFGLFSAIVPYNVLIAAIVSGLGIAFEIEQILRRGKKL